MRTINALKYILVLLFSMAGVGASAAEDYAATVDKFFVMMADNKTDEATDFLFGGNPWLKQAPDQVQNVKSQLASLSRLVGSYQGQEKLVEEKAGTNYVYLLYLGLYERQPIRFKFAFYRPDGKWRFQNFSFDATFSEEVERLADQKLLSVKP